VWTGRRHNDSSRAWRRPTGFWKSAATNGARVRKFCRSDCPRDAGLAPLPGGDVVLVVQSGTIRAALAIALDLIPTARCALSSIRPR